MNHTRRSRRSRAYCLPHNSLHCIALHWVIPSGYCLVHILHCIALGIVWHTYCLTYIHSHCIGYRFISVVKVTQVKFYDMYCISLAPGELVPKTYYNVVYNLEVECYDTASVWPQVSGLLHPRLPPPFPPHSHHALLWEISVEMRCWTFDLLLIQHVVSMIFPFYAF